MKDIEQVEQLQEQLEEALRGERVSRFDYELEHTIRQQLEAELAASREQSAQLAAAGEMLKAQVKYGMSVIESEWNTYPDAMDEAVTAWDTALTAWQQGNK
jgi:hypothetical protein